MNVMNPATQVAVPIRTTNPTKVLTITHSEYVASVVPTSTTFYVSQALDIQPGLAVPFAWLSAIAANYDMYRFTALSLEYIPSCPTTTGGTIYFGFDPNVLDKGPQATSDILQYKVNKQGSPFLQHVVTVPKEILNKKLYTRTGTVSLSDQKTYDIGTFFVVSDLAVANTSWGFTKLNYTIEFYDPQSRSDGYVGYSGLWTGVSGTSFQTTVFNTLTRQIVNPVLGTGNTIQFLAQGTYYIACFNSSSTGITLNGSPNVAFVPNTVAVGTGSSAINATVTVTAPGTLSVTVTGAVYISLQKIS
jgi:hypothetical protein